MITEAMPNSRQGVFEATKTYKVTISNTLFETVEAKNAGHAIMKVLKKLGFDEIKDDTMTLDVVAEEITGS